MHTDTALLGSLAGSICGLDFFGVHNVLFGSDSPFDPEKGPDYIGESIRVIEELPVSGEDRKKIFEESIRRLLKLNKRGSINALIQRKEKPYEKE